MTTILNFVWNMPRLHKPAPGTRQYGTKTSYSAELLNSVVEDIKSGKIGQREASRKYKIPRQTLVNKLNNKHCKKVGKPVIFSEEEEASFVSHCTYLSKMGIPIGMYDLRLIIKSYLDSKNRSVSTFKCNMPGYDWGKSFLDRHKSTLKECFAKNISQKRAVVDEQIIRNFFTHFESEVESVPSSNIFNMDETGFHDNPASKKLLFPRTLRHAENVLNQTKACYTGVFCGSADGKLLPPYFIFSGKNKWGDWMINASPGARMNVTDCGWMDQGVMEDWIQNMFLPWIRKQNLTGKKILICDNLSAHISLNALKICEENYISFLTFPANSTHLLQPLDLSFFASLKSHWRTILSEWRATPDGKRKIALPKSTFVALVKEAINLGSYNVHDILKKGFEKSGLCPVNCQMVIEKLPLYAKTDSKVTEEVGEEFIKFVESIRKKDLGVKKVQKLKLPVEPGKSISAEEVRLFYEKREKEKEVKEREREEKKMIKEEKKKERLAQKTLITRSGPRTRGGTRRRFQGLRTTLQTSSNLIYIDDQPSTSTQSSESQANGIRSSNNSLWESDILIDELVIVLYNEKLFPGKVTEIIFDVEGEKSYKISCMSKKGKFWVWPDKTDECFYEREDIIKKIDNIKLINKRGMYEIKERLLYNDEEFDFYDNKKV